VGFGTGGQEGGKAGTSPQLALAQEVSCGRLDGPGQGTAGRAKPRQQSQGRQKQQDSIKLLLYPWGVPRASPCSRVVGVLSHHMCQRQRDFGGCITPLVSILSLCHTRNGSDGKTCWSGRQTLHPSCLGAARGAVRQRPGLRADARGPRLAFFGNNPFEAVCVTMGGFVGMCHEWATQLRLSVGHCTGTGRMLENWQVPLEQIPGGGRFF